MAEMLVLLSHQLSKILKNKMGHPVLKNCYYRQLRLKRKTFFFLKYSELKLQLTLEVSNIK